MFVPYKPYNRDSYDDNGTHALFQRVRVCIDNVERHSSRVPRRDKNGDSECPFADTLYDEAQEWMAEARDQRQQLEKHAGDAAHAMARAKEKEHESHFNDDPRCTDDWKRHRDEYQQHEAARAKIRAKVAELDECLRTAAEVIASRQEA